MSAMSRIKINDISTMIHYMGYICLFLGLFMLTPIIVAIIYNETNFIFSFLISGIISISLGIIFIKFFKRYNMSLKVAMFFSTFIWLIASFLGALPFFMSGELSFINSFFEAISGFTTTGFSMFNPIESTGFTINFWRGLTQWIGGLGIIFTMIIILRSSGTSIMRLYNAEGRSERIVPSIRNTSKIILYIYLILTVIGFLLFIISGLPIFDSLFYTFVTLSTGGFGITSNSILYYNSPWVELAAMIVMILGSINFALIYLLFKKKFREFFSDIEIKVAIILIPLFVIIVSAFLIKFNVYGSFFENIRFGTFQVVSAISTTGLQTAFYPDIIKSWPSITFFIILISMIIGGGSCSTSGGIKWLRIGLLFKAIFWQVKSFLLPGGAVIPKKVNHFKGLKVNNDLLRITGLFVFLYLLVYVVSVLIVLCYYNNLSQVLFEIASAMGNVGLTSGILTPNSPDFIKVVFMVDFWLGRLEIWPVLLVILMGVTTIREKIKFNH
ncbi:Trk system potassium uptake protein TrkG [bioreactor metagenome]|uniref:Trk system potassium uptake protein TrkG n=1 Tax=bioreactor metagenome TaxID=1076179 RepID=A0A644V4D3_9ZZZZ|nr:TrkH family potassium uptake protein [Methanobrevibacter sp.]MEA4958055.1 TrkH family potassium uptake protein [Methanobrevibacter sp.]